MNQDTICTIFISTWAVLGAIAFYLFYLNKNVEMKRRLWPLFNIFIGVLFVVFISLMGFPLQTLFIAIPGVALIVFLNIRSVKFCDNCGRITHGRTPFSTTKFCSHCGTAVD